MLRPLLNSLPIPFWDTGMKKATKRVMSMPPKKMGNVQSKPDRSTTRPISGAAAPQPTAPQSLNFPYWVASFPSIPRIELSSRGMIGAINIAYRITMGIKLENDVACEMRNPKIPAPATATHMIRPCCLVASPIAPHTDDAKRVMKGGMAVRTPIWLPDSPNCSK